MKMIRVLLVDDQPSIRQGLRMRLALEPDIDVVGEAGDGHAAVALARSLDPDVVLMDVQMPGGDGVAATRQIAADAPGCAVVILSLYDDDATRARCQQAGAREFVSKCRMDQDLLGAIRGAAAA
jgi:DNA-binding NarL/FixJ family response regulator